MPKNRDAPHFILDYLGTLNFYANCLSLAAKDGPEAVKATRRDLGSNDLFFFMVFVLKRADMNHPWIFARCREFQREPDFHLDLWARDHYKSTIITFGYTLFELTGDPELTFAIFSHTKPIAKKFLAQLKLEMETNKDLPDLWPEVFWEDPARQAPTWSLDSGLILNRKTNPKEATIEAHGLVDGQPTSKHFNRKIYDDVVTLESVSTAEQIAKTTAALQMSDNLGTEGGIDRYIGTRYHMFDTYHWMMEAKVATVRLRPATENGKEDGKPVFRSQETLDKKRRNQGLYVYACQMLLDPKADSSMGFKTEWLVHRDTDYHAAMRSLWIFIICDPAGSKKRKNNDFTTFWVIGFGSDGIYRVLEIVRDKLNLSGRAKTLFSLHRKWKPKLVAYEEYGMQADIEHYEYVMKQDLYEFVITPIGGAMPKPLRIMRLVPYFENGWKEGQDPNPRIHLPTRQNYIDYQGHNRDLVKDFVEEEYSVFPVLSHDDMLDGLSRISDLEQMKLIEAPKEVPAPSHGNKVSRNLAKTTQGTGSWMVS